jgi:hypothetical protein
MACLLVNAFRITFIILGTLALLVALVLNAFAVILPSWNTLDMTEVGQRYEHGLWGYCVTYAPLSADIETSTTVDTRSDFSARVCYWKGEMDEKDERLKTHFAGLNLFLIFLEFIRLASGRSKSADYFIWNWRIDIAYQFLRFLHQMVHTAVVCSRVLGL